jgi:hypothetical protein
MAIRDIELINQKKELVDQKKKLVDHNIILFKRLWSTDNKTRCANSVSNYMKTYLGKGDQLNFSSKNVFKWNTNVSISNQYICTLMNHAENTLFINSNTNIFILLLLTVYSSGHHVRESLRPNFLLSGKFEFEIISAIFK